MQRRHRKGLSESKRPEHRGVSVCSGVVHLVGDEDDGLLGTAKERDDVFVCVRGPHRRVENERDHVSLGHRTFGLSGHLRCHALGLALPAAGVHHEEAVARPFALVHDAIAGHARHVFDHGLASTEHAIHERRLADVGTAHDGDDRKKLVVLVVESGHVIDFESERAQRGSVDLLAIAQVVDLDKFVVVPGCVIGVVTLQLVDEGSVDG